MFPLKSCWCNSNVHNTHFTPEFWDGTAIYGSSDPDEPAAEKPLTVTNLWTTDDWLNCLTLLHSTCINNTHTHTHTVLQHTHSTNTWRTGAAVCVTLTHSHTVLQHTHCTNTWRTGAAVCVTHTHPQCYSTHTVQTHEELEQQSV